jgi:hypothetical protein
VQLAVQVYKEIHAGMQEPKNHGYCMAALHKHGMSGDASTHEAYEPKQAGFGTLT